jgi:hypothetical protein
VCVSVRGALVKIEASTKHCRNKHTEATERFRKIIACLLDACTDEVNDAFVQFMLDCCAKSKDSADNYKKAFESSFAAMTQHWAFNSSTNLGKVVSKEQLANFHSMLDTVKEALEHAERLAI